MKKQSEETTVYEAAIKRFNTLYDRFDRVVISFSGGKDSTVCMQLAHQVAKERGRLPVEMFTFDEEAIPPETVEYMERIAANPDYKFDWLCLEVKHRNACSRSEPYWYCWDREKQDLWTRPMPKQAITEWTGAAYKGSKLVKVPFQRGMTIPQFAHMMYGDARETVVMVRGLRADESMRRYQSVTARAADNWMMGPIVSYWSPTYQDWLFSGRPKGNFWVASPIYDWTTIDVWTAPRLNHWDYNRAYDVMQAAGVSPSQQRCCPPYGEEPLGRLWTYAVCWPDLWHKMIHRVHGAATAGRYARSEIYSFGKEPPLPEGMTWRDRTFAYLELYPPELKRQVSNNIRKLIAAHKEKTNRSIPDESPDLMSGISWKFLAQIANRGDLKGRKSGMMVNKGWMEAKKRGISLEQVFADYANEAETRY